MIRQGSERERPAALGELVEQCARLPLALRVAAELAVTRSATPLAQLAGELRDPAAATAASRRGR